MAPSFMAKMRVDEPKDMPFLFKLIREKMTSGCSVISGGGTNCGFCYTDFPVRGLANMMEWNEGSAVRKAVDFYAPDRPRLRTLVNFFGVSYDESRVEE